MGAYHTHVQLIEVVWICIGLAGLAPSVVNLWANIVERLVLRKKGINSAAQTFAVGIIWVESLILVSQFILVIIGFIAMFVPDLPQNVETEGHINLGRVVTISMFFVQSALAIRSWISFFIRRHIYEFAEASHIDEGGE